VAEIEGKNDNDISNKNKSSNAFVTLSVNIKEEKVREQYSDSYFTLIRLLIVSYIIPYVKTLVNNLNN
jgi:hypothetical protein